MLKELDCPGSMFDCLNTDIGEFINNTEFTGTHAKDVMDYIEKHLEEFLQEIIYSNECGATLRIIRKKLEETQLTKEYIYELMWPNNEIAERYAEDFEFDINDFGYEYFIWGGHYYLVSGISA